MKEGKKIEVRFYRSAAGKEPVRDWLLKLSPHERKILGEEIRTVEFDWPIGMPLCRNLGKGLWEVRASLHNRIARVLFCIEDGTM